MPGSSRDRIEEQKMSCDNLDLIQLSRHYKLARISKLHEGCDEHTSLATANVQNNEEMLLVRCSSGTSCILNSHNNDTASVSCAVAKQSNDRIASSTTKQRFNYDSDSDSEDSASTTSAPPTQLHIDLATEHLEAKNMRGPNVVSIDFDQSDVHYDIRKILISLATTCALHIGAGPYASRIINMLKQRLVQRKQHEQDTKQCLIEMGFARSKVQHALNINKYVHLFLFLKIDAN